jgi:hypothetical protein
MNPNTKQTHTSYFSTKDNNVRYSMGVKVFFVVTIDTEIDKSKDWKVSENETFFSVLDGIPKNLTPLFNRFGVKPTYLLSSEVIENNDCVNVLKNLKNCELGTHLHGDLIGPHKKIYKLSRARIAAMQNSYRGEIEYQKLKNLTDLFIEKFGYHPVSFRAGRFAASHNTINSLEKLGYLIDSSITPGVDWNYPEGRANFINAKNQPYFSNKENILEIGDSKILEVPLSIINSKFKKYFYFLNNTKPLQFLNKITVKILPIYWLRPSFQNVKEMLYVIKKITKQNSTKKNIVLNMMFHSMEVIPNASPYNKTEKDRKEFLKKIEKVLEYCKINKFSFVTLSELYPRFKR